MARITGINSGLDIDALVKASMIPYQSKIDTETQNKKVLEYQQEQYKKIISDAANFYDKYFDILKSDGLMSTTGYQTQTYTAIPEGKVTAKGFAGANIDNYTVSVTQLAAKASSTLDTSTLGTKVIKIGEAEISFEAVSDGNTTVSNYNVALAEMKRQLSDRIKAGNVSGGEEKQLADLNDNSVIAKYSQFTKSVVFTSSQMRTDGFTLGKKNVDATISYQDKAEDKYLEATIRNSSGNVYTITSADKKTTNIVTVDNVEFTFKAPTVLTSTTSRETDELSSLTHLEGLKKDPVLTLNDLTLTPVSPLVEDGTISTTIIDEADGTKTKTIISADKKKSTVIVTSADGTTTTNKEEIDGTIKTTIERSNGITTTTEVKADGTTTTYTKHGTQIIASRTTGIPQMDKEGKPTTTIPISTEIIQDAANTTTTINLKSVDGKTTTTIKEINNGIKTTTTTSTKEENVYGSTTTEITEIKDNSSGYLTNTKITKKLATADDGSSTKTTRTTKTTTEGTKPETINLDETTKYVYDKVSLTGQTDVIALKDKIVKFVDDYNKLLSTINTKLYETRDKDYMPLTDEQKKSMSEDQITAWEKKAQTGLLRKDTDLERITREMKSAISSVMSGTGLYLEKIGINPVKDYVDKNGMLTVDEDKLTKALQENAGDVKDLFTRAASDTNTTDKGGLLTQLKSVVYSEFKTSTSLLSKKAGFSGSSTELNNTITKNIATKKKLITKLNDQYTLKENALYKRYSVLETALQKLNSQQSSLTSMLGQN